MDKKPNSKARLKKAQLSFYPEPEQYEELKALSAETGVPQQVYLRRGLEHVLEWERQRRPDGKGNVHIARLKKEVRK